MGVSSRVSREKAAQMTLSLSTYEGLKPVSASWLPLLVLALSHSRDPFQKHLISQAKKVNDGSGHYHEGQSEIWHPRQLHTGIDHPLDLSGDRGT